MEFVLIKANYASFNGLLRRSIVSIAEECEELSDDPVFFVDFLYALNELQFLNQDEELNEAETNKLQQVYKENIKQFVVCHQLWQKFRNGFKYLDLITMKYAIIFQLNKSKSFIKNIKKLELLQAKVTVVSKTFF